MIEPDFTTLVPAARLRSGAAYFGKICAKHPELNGKRIKGSCVDCRRESRHERYNTNPLYRSNKLVAARERYKNDPEYRARVAAACHKSYLKHKEQRLKAARERRSTDPEYKARRQKQALILRQKPGYKEKSREAHLKRKYNMSIAQKEARLQRQGGVCAICGASSPGGRGGWHTDHDKTLEKTQGIIQIRGILCSACNLGDGMFKSDLKIAQSYVAYLKRALNEH